MNRRVIATARFEGFHCWPDAPDEVAFLRDRHRHVFHVRAEKAVTHSDRDVEFVLLGRAVKAFCEGLAGSAEVESWSCEHWAEALIERFDLTACEVWEDGENGARVEA